MSFRSLVYILLFAAVAIRVPGLFSDLWLDELWSVENVAKLSAFHEIFTKLHVDNNHLLQSFYLYFVGPDASFLVMRLLPFTTAVGLLLLVAYEAGNSRSARLSALILSGFSFPMIIYSSEARGYMPALFFAILACVALKRIVAERGLVWLCLFQISIVLGFFSHLTFLFFSASLTVSVLLWQFKKTGLKGSLRMAVTVFALPSALIFITTWLHYGAAYAIAGGPPRPIWLAIANAVLGGVGVIRVVPGEGAAGILFLIVVSVLIALLLAIAWMQKQGNPQWLFFALCIFVFPGLMFAASSANYISERYFLIPLLACYALFSLHIVPLLARRKASCVVLFILFGFFLLGHSLRIAPFLEHGRGSYALAVGEIALRGTEQSPHRLALEYPRWAERVFGYYAKRQAVARQVKIVNQEASPESIMLLTFNHQASPLNCFGTTKSYRLHKQYPYGGISGWHWWHYLESDQPCPA